MRLTRIVGSSIIALGLSTVWAETVRELHVFLPDNATWNSSTPMIYEDGQSHALTPDPDHCGWFIRKYVDEEIPNKVVFHTDDDEELRNSIGMGGENSDSLQAIPLADVFQVFASEATFINTLYFVADGNRASELPSATKGWFTERPMITGTCSFNLAATIYDTDASLHPSFSCYAAGGEGCQAQSGLAAQDVERAKVLEAINACLGVTTGLVDSTLDKTIKKPKLSAAGKKCFIDEKYFNQLFNYTEGVNEASCFDIPFTRTNHGKWEFNSDNFTSPNLRIPVPGGFFPVEGKTNELVKSYFANQVPAPAARTKHYAEGPIFHGEKLRKIDSTEFVPVFDLTCNGPGWNKGHDCNGLFADAAETETFFKSINSTIDCVFGWSCTDQAPTNWPLFTEGSETKATAGVPRWSSNVSVTEGNGGRNQHFCAEMHSTFRFKNGLKFSISGSDDIWVYIDNKLAIDIGGTHLAAPGYVDVDKFMPNATIGELYDIDIFYCNRRTTSGDLKISTSMLFPKFASGIRVENSRYNTDPQKVSNFNTYKVCRAISDGTSCTPTTIVCDTADAPKTMKIRYQLTTDKTGTDATKTLISEAEFTANPIQLNGIFDVSNPMRPVINENKLKETFNPGTYYLIVKIDSDQYVLQLQVKGTTSVAERRIPASITNNFSIAKSGALEITITTEKMNIAKQYAIMDINGHVISNGKLNSSDTRVKVATAGSYIVKVGNNYKRINIK
ncbi:fibro-slime domain-containing protein [Fibrobacter sp. UWB12]|uniref:fibro-slime domain-containing protein n=1 Tax=Fibrobacter sp. UWB12 TaxID=1896203 RepID=UPI00091639FB|nr:fibro-slime domain-containing protein [Fibrobacter sp. UWB12]SHK88940.1 fibro-slime domain-containing protein [Fibrobacter sp. UWB12]